MYRFIGRHTPEILALLCATVAVVWCSLLAWFVDPPWLNRGGALVIIVGVLLAASRFQEWVQQKLATFMETNFDSIADDALRTVEKEARPLSDAERSTIKAQMKVTIHKNFAEIFEADERRLKAWEVWLVVLGTFLNGFGDFLIRFLKSYGT
jgi:hypothetical protein